MRVIIDASVTVSWLLSEIDDPSVERECVTYLMTHDYGLLAPRLLIMEILTVLRWRHKLEKREVKLAMDRLADLEIEWIDSHMIQEEQLLSIMYQHELTACDAWYLEVVQDTDCQLLTHDKALLKADKKRCLTPKQFLEQQDV